MNVRDVFSGNKQISRLDAAKYLIKQTLLSDPQFSYGIILFNASSDYIIPPTFDTWIFLLYLSWITTNLLPDWSKDFAQLSWLLNDTTTSYLIISDFDAKKQNSSKFPRWTSLLGVWSLAGDKVRNSNGILYYHDGTSVSSIRNDQFARSLSAHYTALSQVDSLSIPHLVTHGFILPLSQRIILYGLLGVLVILIIML